MADPKSVQYADLESLVGQTLGPSDWFEVDQTRINTFADATGDHQTGHEPRDQANLRETWLRPSGAGVLRLFGARAVDLRRLAGARRVGVA